jgi:hypothetical protein
MTPEKQRIAIAEACGWNSKSDFQINANLRYHVTWVESENRGFFIPDYLNDLNAMHEAEKLLTNVQWSIYAPKLCLITNQRPATYYCHATAAQRAEAFLRTIGKWEISDD